MGNFIVHFVAIYLQKNLQFLVRKNKNLKGWLNDDNIMVEETGEQSDEWTHHSVIAR